MDVADTAEAAASFERTTKNSSEVLTINVHTDVNRIKGSLRQGGSSVKATDIVSAFVNFQKNYDCVPQKALLCHYSVIDHRIPLPQHVFPSLDTVLATALQALYTSQSQLLTSPMAQAVEDCKMIDTVCDEVRSLDVGNSEAVSKTRLRVQECVNAVDLWRLRQDLLGDAQKLEKKDLKYGYGALFSIRSISSR